METNQKKRKQSTNAKENGEEKSRADMKAESATPASNSGKAAGSNKRWTHRPQRGKRGSKNTDKAANEASKNVSSGVSVPETKESVKVPEPKQNPAATAQKGKTHGNGKKTESQKQPANTKTVSSQKAEPDVNPPANKKRGRPPKNMKSAEPVTSALKAPKAENTGLFAGVLNETLIKKDGKVLIPGAESKRGPGRPAKKDRIKIYMLGGLNEIGKNLACIECGDDIVIIDCGLGFPDGDMLGIDLVIPDVSYLERNKDKIRGMLITHGHEDHIGAIPYVLRQINPPIYGTKLTLGIIAHKLEEHVLENKPHFACVEAGDRVKLGCFEAEFIHVNHSIADACCIALHTPLGTIVHSGDFKLDLTPVTGEMMDLTRLGELGREGVLLLMCESTNAERPGYTPSEKKVGASFENILNRYKNNRIIIATFSSNVHRVQQIINLSAKYGRKVAVTGRSMINIVGAAAELGYMSAPKDVLIDISEINRYAPEKVTLVTTGSQGEPMSALYRMAYSCHDKVTITEKDVVVISANPIPGNEVLVGNIVNELYRRGVTVLNDATAEVHVSGHACQEELKLMHALTKPKYFMPIHGEYRHLINHKRLAEYMGMPSQNIFVASLGQVLEIDRNGCRFNGSVPSGRVLIDGYGIGDVGSTVLRDRKQLSQDGLIAVVAAISADNGDVISGPEIISRGFVYVKESEELIESARQNVLDTLMQLGGTGDIGRIRTALRENLSKFLYAKMKRSPVILPFIMEV